MKTKPARYGDPATSEELAFLKDVASSGGWKPRDALTWEQAQVLIIKGYIGIFARAGESEIIELTDRGRIETRREEKTMPKQTEIKGTERYRNTKLTEAGETYKKLRDKAIQAGNKAADAKQALLDVMRSCTDDLAEVDGEFIYVDDEAALKFIYSNKENVKVRTLKDGDDGDDE